MRSSTESYVYTKDMRESTINVVGKSGTAPVSYEYTDYGETEILGNQNFYNEVCYGAGIYDKTTELYYLNARYYSPENGAFLTQDTYRGDRSRTATLNYYSYCAGNPINYTDPSGHAIWGILGAAMGAYDGYKYAKKKKLKGWKKAAAIVGGAALGAVNPFKVVKVAKKVYKAAKFAKAARSAKKAVKAAKLASKKPKVVKINGKKFNATRGKPLKQKKFKKAKGKSIKRIGGECFVAGTKISTENGFAPIEQIKPGDHVWSENPETNEKALKKVNKIFVREKDSIIRLSINGEVTETTDEHPFYVENRGFVGAGNLEAGDKVRLQNGGTATVDSVEEIQLEKPIKVYNFEVEDFHTYYVSDQQVLVHNTCASKSSSKSTTIKKQTNSSKKVASKNNNSTDIVPYYPANDGAVSGTKTRIHLMPGQKIDRFGSTSGKYFAPAGTPIEQRALPYDADTSIYAQYEVVKPFEVEASTIAPAFGQPGGGTQYRCAVSAETLLKRGIIKEYGGV